MLTAASHLLLALPMLWFGWQFALALSGGDHDLGANPVQYSIRFLGLWAVRLLLLGLALRPLASLTGSSLPMTMRRRTGLWAFAYAFAHLLIYFVYDLDASVAALWADVLKRYYITLGMAALLLLVPLAATSTRAAIKRLGGRAWQRLHRLVYGAALLACVHFLLMVKGTPPEPRIYLSLFLLLMLWRLPWRRLRSSVK
jgi:methionine sulfoxide reductase heme-binding subunit